MIFTLGYLGGSYLQSTSRKEPISYFYSSLGPSDTPTTSYSLSLNNNKFVGVSTTTTDLCNIYEIDGFGNLQELKQVSADAAFLDAEHITNDLEGNYYISGRVSGVTCYLQKRNAQNLESWSVSLAATSPSAESFLSSVTDSSGNVIAVGHGKNTSSASVHDGLIVKYDSSGAVVWQKFIGDNSTQLKVTSVGLDSDENIYVCLSNENLNPALVKLTSDGTIDWQIQNHFAEVTELSNANIKVDPFNNVFLYFTTTGLVDDESTLVAKYSSTGTLLWQRHIGVVGTDLYSSDLVVDSQGSVYLLCISSTSKNNTIIKLLDSGVVSWERTISMTPNTTNYLQLRSISLDSYGSYALFGDISAANPATIKLPRGGDRLGEYDIDGTLTLNYSVASASIDSPVNVSTSTSYATTDSSYVEGTVVTTTTDLTPVYNKKEIV
jgi:hypothetical protein